MGRPRTAVIVLLGIAGSAIGVTASAAAGLSPASGTPAALRLVRGILHREAHTVAVRWTNHGGAWECPPVGGEPLFGPSGRSPGKGCSPATLTQELNLRDGRITAEIEIGRARGYAPAITATVKRGTFLWWKARHCWDNIDSGGTSNVPALDYAGERVTIISRRGTTDVLRGAEHGAVEFDTVDTTVDRITRIFERVDLGPLGEARMHSVFTYPGRPFVVTAKPQCPEVVKLSGVATRVRGWTAR